MGSARSPNTGSIRPNTGSIRLNTGFTRPRAGAALLLAIATVSLVGCGGDGGDTGQSSSGAGGGRTVVIQDYAYEPARVTVPAGTTVTFTNRDSTPHTATSKQPGAFESGSLDSGKSGKVTLKETGSFAYYCLFHPFMKGTVVVE